MIEDLKIVKDNIKIANSLNIDNIKFYPDENENINILESIKTFGKILFCDFQFKLKKCPENIKESKKYIISGEKQNIITVIGEGGE